VVAVFFWGPSRTQLYKCGKVWCEAKARTQDKKKQRHCFRDKNSLMRKKFVVSVTLVTVSGIFPSPLWQGQTMFLTLSVFFTAVPYENIADAATFRLVRRGRKKTRSA
jgi:hypothetical protein